MKYKNIFVLIFIPLFAIGIFATTYGQTQNDCPLDMEKAYKEKGNSSVYFVTINCTKKVFKNSKIFFTYFDSWDDVISLSEKKLHLIPNDTIEFLPWGPTYDPKYGAVVKILHNPKVYLLLGEKKYWITSENVFTALGYKWNWIEDIDDTVLNNYSLGEEITYTDHHPSYTLVKYATSPDVFQLLPDPNDLKKQVKKKILNEDEFKQLGFRWDRIVLIAPAEKYPDFSTAPLPPSSPPPSTPVWSGAGSSCGDNMCQTDTESNNACPLDCPSNTQSILRDEQLSVIVPKGYELLAEGHMRDLKYCFPLLKEFLGTAPYYNSVLLHIQVSDSNYGAAGLNTILYGRTQQNMDMDFESYTQKKEDSFLFQSGPSYCANTHEFTHVFMAAANNALSPGWSEEGIAEYAQKNLQGDLKANRICTETGIHMLNVETNSTAVFPYPNLETDKYSKSYHEANMFYAGGMCFWEYLDKQFGRQKMQAVIAKHKSFIGDEKQKFNYHDSQNNIAFPSYDYVDEVLLPVLGEDIWPLLNKFGMTKERKALFYRDI